MKKVLNCFADFFFISHCSYCGCGVEKGGLICKDCAKSLEKTEKKLCIKCSLPKKKCMCGNYVYHFSRCTAPFYNKGIAQKGFYKFKFYSAKELSLIYADAMCQRVRNDYFDIPFSKITFVPTGFSRQIKRGYDQSRVLAEYISNELNIPLVEGVLKRTLFSRTQHKRVGIHKRFSNAYRNYYAKGSIEGNVLLVDDIKTTGASLDACSRQLLYAGADEVFCITALVTDKKS
ncbi:MAG: hypothetical protein U0M42_05470 [Acutalibacteraceae bacterium]|nr:hypothetical protein [Acutalibacteraceae bacterium]